MIPDFPNFHRMLLAVWGKDNQAGWWLGQTDALARTGHYEQASRKLAIAVAPYFAATWDAS